MKHLHRYRKVILLATSIGNVIGAGIAIFAPAFFLEQLFAVPPQAEGTFPYLPMYHYTFWATVLIMGIGYWMTAITPEQNRAVLFIGGAGKLVCASFWFILFAQGAGNWLMISGAVYDGVFGVLLLVLFFAKPVEKV